MSSVSQPGFRPQLAVTKLPLNDLPDRRIGNVEEAADVGRVVFNNAGMGLKNIHMRSLILLFSIMATNSTASHYPEEATHVAEWIGEDAAYGLVLYGHRSSSMLIESDMPALSLLSRASLVNKSLLRLRYIIVPFFKVSIADYLRGSKEKTAL